MYIIHAGFCPGIKSIGTNGPLGLKRVGHFRKCGALVNFPYATTLSAFRQVSKTKELLDYSKSVHSSNLFLKIKDNM